MTSVPREFDVDAIFEALAQSARDISKSASSLHLERLFGVSPELEIAPGIFLEMVNRPAEVADQKRAACASATQSVIQDEPMGADSADRRVNGGCSGDSTKNADDRVKMALTLVNTIGQRLLARRKAAAVDIDASPYGKTAPDITSTSPAGSKQANSPLLRNPVLPGAYSVTATPEQQSQNQAAAQNPVAQATQASTVGPGNTPNANPIGSYGPLAANPGQVTGNASLGVKNNVMKIGAARELAEIFDAKVSNDFWDALGAGFRHVFEHGKQAAIGPYEVVVDRPRGYKKTFQTPRGPEESTYPVDYGYLNGLLNPDDNEGLDVFLGQGGTQYGRFMKGRTLEGGWKPDERKWYAGLTPEELAAVKQFYTGQDPSLLQDFVEFPDEQAFLADVQQHGKQATAPMPGAKARYITRDELLALGNDPRIKTVRLADGFNRTYFDDGTVTEDEVKAAQWNLGAENPLAALLSDLEKAAARDFDALARPACVHCGSEDVRTDDTCNNCGKWAAGEHAPSANGDGEGGYWAKDGERCQHCFALHERGDDGNCNSCGKPHDAVPRPGKLRDKQALLSVEDCRAKGREVVRQFHYELKKALGQLTPEDEKQAHVEPMPRWRNPPSKPLDPEFLAQPGVQNLLESLGMEADASGVRVKQALLGAPRRKKRPVINNSIATPLLGLGALGAAGIGGAHALAGDEQAANLGRIVGQHELPLAPHETATTRYQSLMSEGAGVAPFGIPAGEILARVRSQPQIMNAAGLQADAVRPGDFAEARMHYDAFRKGPIAAYQHQLSAKGMGTQVAPELALTHGVKTYDQLMQPHFTAAFKKWRAGQAAQGHVLEGASWLEPHEIDAAAVPLEAQRDFIRQYHEGLPPALQAERQRVETDLWGPGLKNNEKNYRPVIEGGLGVRNALKTVGMTAGGAATGGILGHYLHKALTGGREEGEVNPGYWAATGLGAAAGGAAGYFGGTPQGREMLARFFKRSNWLDKVVAHPVTPFIARPVIGAGVSLGINELVRLLAEQYVGKPVDPEKKHQDRLIAGAMGAGMGLGKAISPYVESMIT